MQFAASSLQRTTSIVPLIPISDLAKSFQKPIRFVLYQRSLFASGMMRSRALWAISMAASECFFFLGSEACWVVKLWAYQIMADPPSAMEGKDGERAKTVMTLNMNKKRP
jgi:hypothetical protein